MNSVLVADDDKFFREQISSFLMHEKYAVTSVDNGKRVIKELNQRKYDAVILDIYMEEINGLQTISIIKNISPSLPIIVITGDDSLELERQARSYGVFYYLVKPFEMREINEVVRLAVTKSSKATAKDA